MRVSKIIRPVACKFWQGSMGPKTPVAKSSELFRHPLCEMLNAKHTLVKLADVDWERVECSFGAYL